MYKPVAILLLCFCCFIAKAQTPVPLEQPYGKVSVEELQMPACDFEKDANAEVLFNFGKILYSDDLKSITLEVHKRIKIFNSNGNNLADIRIPFFSEDRLENITGVEAQTINLVDGKPQVTKLEKKAIVTTILDKENSEVTFAMPNVKPGCIIEYKYKWTGRYNGSMPDWDFQESVPVRYSELDTSIPDVFYFRPLLRVNMPLAKHNRTIQAQVLKVATHTFTISDNGATGDQQSETYNYNANNEVWGMANVPSLRDDAYMSSFEDNVQRLSLDLASIKPIGGISSDFSDTWSKVGYELTKSTIFGDQLNPALNNQDAITAKAVLLASNDEKIAFVFNAVKNAMKWNGMDRWYTIDGTRKAWENKAGNSTEVNLVLYAILKELKIQAYPMVVSTRRNGRPDPWRTSLSQFNRTVVYVPVSADKSYILDATGKYNLYSEPPSDLLNTFGLWVDKSRKTFDTVSIKKELPVRQVVLINAEIKPGGKVEGTAQISSMSYDRINAVKRYQTDGEQKYIDYLRDGDNSLKISGIKFENMDVDTLPLTQNINFNADLPGTDENYIYVNTNMFTSLKSNPFLADSRLSDIYFGYLRNYSINSVYKLPAGYKIDALPKSASMVMPDKSISFKRIIAEQDGSLLVHYVIDIRKAAFNVSEYPGIHDFYKKMFDMLNEQVVLKKGS
ncbi:DUF3857 domain-containing protein [Mucilaginibacter gotjawali]|uniref:DUF3857 domain-containing protein n=1 Tax=Mucilaginibacter gotjawali TaxID=1550579 RepID=A0A839SB40_9SPHI|nr:DUF3857 domain-containing protein [Mucilaginibacter gotjawali]MBB3054798.1 hypothetical protein [Mucilaginibacter gotjawali]